MNRNEPPEALRRKLEQPKSDYQGNHEVFEMPESQKPPEPPSQIPFGKIGGVIAGLVVLVFLGILILSILSNSGGLL